MYIFYQFSVCRTHSYFLICYIVTYLQQFCKGIFFFIFEEKFNFFLKVLLCCTIANI